MKPRSKMLAGGLLGTILTAAVIAAYLAFGRWGKYDPAAPERITCVRNLKQVGIGMRTWALDHGDAFPFQLSTNEGGSLEFCSRNKEGFDVNSALHFQAASSELTLPVILVCPDDHSKAPAASFSALQSSNVTYRLRSGASATYTNSTEVLAVCPIDGNTLYCDGQVKQGKKR